jgi:hypothetical protein
MKRLYLAALACLVGATIGGLHAQQLDDRVIANAQFSADVTTTVTQTLGDGTRIEQRTTGKLYRDSTGRVRREQTVIGLDRLNPAAQPQTTITFDSVPGDPAPYSLNPVNKTARRGGRRVQWLTGAGVGGRGAGANAQLGQVELVLVDLLNNVNGNAGRTFRSGAQAGPIPSDIKPTEESLGTRQVEGVKATGSRSTTVIPAGRIGNDRDIRIVEEQWDSPELNMVMSSRFSDPRTGVVEYRLTNVSRSEPRADLFIVPSDYTVIEANGGGRGGRGAGGGEPVQPTQGGRVGGRGGRGN